MNNNKLGMSPQQNERYQSLVLDYGPEKTAELVTKHLSARGINSWSSVQDKIAALRNSSKQEKKYEDAFYEEFKIDTIYTYDEIIQKVSSLRVDLGLPHYSRSIKTNSIDDFLNLFIVEKVYDEESEGNKKREIGYRPVFRLKPIRG